MDNPKFQIFQSTANSEFYFRLKAGNGEIILSSEGYTTKQNCGIGIASVKEHALNDNNYERKDANQNHTFNLKATNGEIVGRSQNYSSSSARDNGITAVKREAPTAAVEEVEE